ncbi:type I secretion system permease/ATPase [Poseidonibacter lekithochrous]|uniref:type I secretion system permease/ATPase n=1 Tax=Poseidonibacter TaxID=2321187 RepID=UPI001C094678|nr:MULTISPECIES: type I secretion system permease/ATPase [Poseidonibacter]MBU3014249.1 type I secretion system permease/ATPase [Poseidonibacter lekithochrous]MDO6827546.1 type I secretion system permease/ATPase [Poseidonibacter sp. 1_MG-2023]
MAQNNKKVDDIEYSELKETISKAKKSIIMVGFFSMFINLLMLVPPLYMLQLYDRVVASRSESTLIMLTLIVVILFITMGLLEVVRSRVLIKFGNKFSNLLSDRVFDSSFELANKKPESASSRLMGDLMQIRQFLSGNGLFAFFDAPWIPIYIGVLFLFHTYFGIFAIFAAIVLVIFTLLNEYTTKEKMNEANSLNRESMMQLESSLRNAEVVNAMGMKTNIRKKWQTKYFGFLNAQNDASTKASIWSNTSKTSRMFFQSMMLGLGAYLAINMELSAGMMIAGSILMGRALAPLDLMINTWKGFSGARMSFKRVDELLKDFPKDKDYMELPSPKGVLSIENVFAKPPASDNYSLQELSLKVEKGDIVGVVGPSAAGKSTFARIVLGVWPVAHGTVRMDGADISQWDREHLGKFIGYLPQDIELFEGTISENIARFSEVDSKKVIEAAMKAGVHDMILRLADGYDTVIGKAGMTLSGGQRQRIGLARAIYDNPVFIVLDEPNSNLDDQGEIALLKTVEELKKTNTTMIIITHRPNILKATNKLAMMNNGKVEKYGNTNEIFASIAQQKAQASAAQQTQAAQQKPKTTQQITLSKPGS